MVIPDGSIPPAEAVKRIRRTLYPVQDMPMDVVACRASIFRQRQQGPSLERTVARKGVLLYGSQGLSREWLDFAHMDLSSAEFLLGCIHSLWRLSAITASRLREKFLKAVLIYYGVEAPKTHDLVLLCKLCVQLDQSWEQMIDACVELSPYGVQVRYPSDMELNESDVSSALRRAGK